MIQELKKIKEVEGEIYKELEFGHLKADYIIENMEVKIPRANFYRRLKAKKFNFDELLEIAKVLRPKEAILEEIKQKLNQAENDIKEGKIYSNEDVINQLKKEFF